MLHNTLTARYAKIAIALRANGWKTGPSPMAHDLASREYQTAAGSRDAFLVDFWPSDDTQVTLNGIYLSEGRNILSTVFEHIELQWSQDVVNTHVAKFLQKVDEAIDDSYARRLYLLGGMAA